MTTTYSATAAREGRWWVITVDGVGVTQSRTLRDAPAAAVGLVVAMLDVEDDEVIVGVVPELDERVRAMVDGARKKVADLEEQQKAVARASREAAAALVGAGLTGADTAAVLGISPQRVSQLFASSAANTRKDFELHA